MKKKRFFVWALVLFVLFAGLFLNTGIVNAASCEGVDTTITQCGEKESGIGYLLGKVIDVLNIGIGSLGVIGVLWAGLQYLTARDNEEQVRKAKRRLLEIVMGLALYALAAVVLPFIFPGLSTSNIKHYDIPEIPDTPQNSKPEEVKKTYRKLFVTRRFAASGGLPFEYKLSVPKDATSDMALLILMHGDNEGGVGFLESWAHGAFKKGKKIITIVPRVHNNNYISSSYFMRSLSPLIKKTMKDYDINKKKVYIMGFSHGAYTVAGAVASFKNGFFSGVAPMACSVSLSNVKGTMVYLLIGSRDQVCGGVRGMNHTKNSAYRAGAKKVW